MKKTFSSKKSAFSLIELSIVLIIIGLLIAGVTGGASLIKSSELRSVMGEARGYAVLVNAFYTQYNGLPGDYSTALGSQSTYKGDGDATIEFAATYNTIPGNESAIAFYQLYTLGAISTSLTAAASSTAQVAGTHLPTSKVKSAGWAFDYISSQNVAVLTGTTAVTTADAQTLNTKATGVITPADALSIDAKIDDGLANAGKIRGGLTAATGSSSCTDNALSTSAPTLYSVSNTTKTCSLTYQVDVNS